MTPESSTSPYSAESLNSIRHQNDTRAGTGTLSTSPDGLTSNDGSPALEHPSRYTAIYEGGNTIKWPQESIAMLDKRDLDLFSHYLSHTSRTIPFDSSDAYALQIGFPNLAFGNQPLMSSILALSATCQCHDILTDEKITIENVAKVQELLQVAEQHHLASLRTIQEAISTTARYDCVLANAALMVLYGSASHCVRIKMVDICKRRELVLPADVMPVQSQWINLIRAVHFAYRGLVAEHSEDAALGLVKNPLSRHMGSPTIFYDSKKGDLSSPQDGPTDDTRRLFLPIVLSTSTSAMAKLRTRARLTSQTPADDSETQACLDALRVLEQTMKQVSTSSSPPRAPDPVDTPSAPLPHVVAPWLQVYISRVTSNNGSSSRPLRRSVNSFLNRVPASYVDLVQTTLDGVDADGGEVVAEGWTSPDEPHVVSAACLLSVDIFAHWLVLVLLLDGVWWIGETGSWELGRVVDFMRRRGRLRGVMGCGGQDSWWPESMYRLRTELKKHVQ